jgi:hypothetical protein
MTIFNWLVIGAVAVALTRAGRLTQLGLARVMLAAGVIGMAGLVGLPRLGDHLQQVELPAVFATTTLSAADGRRYSLSGSLRRVQRYSPAGAFELGWFVPGQGMLAIGITADDRIVIGSNDPKSSQIFSADGVPDGATRPHRQKGNGKTGVMWPRDFAVEGVPLAQPQIASNPQSIGVALRLLPLTHWLVAWALLSAGFCLLMIPWNPASDITRPGTAPTNWQQYEPTYHELTHQSSAWSMLLDYIGMYFMIISVVLAFVILVAIPVVRLIAH